MGNNLQGHRQAEPLVTLPSSTPSLSGYRGRYQAFDSRPLVLPDRIDPLELPHPMK